MVAAPGSQIQRTFLQPSKTVVNDLLLGSANGKGNGASFKRQMRENHPGALLQNPLAYEVSSPYRPMEVQQAPSMNPFEIGGGDSLFLDEVNPLARDKAALLLHSQIDNSIELMEPTAPNEEAVASEDVDAEDSNSRHCFGNNKELFEHTQSK